MNIKSLSKHRENTEHRVTAGSSTSSELSEPSSFKPGATSTWGISTAIFQGDFQLGQFWGSHSSRKFLILYITPYLCWAKYEINPEKPECFGLFGWGVPFLNSLPFGVTFPGGGGWSLEIAVQTRIMEKKMVHCLRYPLRIHGTKGISTYMNGCFVMVKYGFHVGKYTSPMHGIFGMKKILEPETSTETNCCFYLDSMKITESWHQKKVGNHQTSVPWKSHGIFSR